VGNDSGMELSLALTLPRDEQTVPVARHIVRSAMAEVGVEEACVYDVELALSEACTNVLLHSGPGDQYVVRLDLEDGRGMIRVIDVGRGFDSVTLQAEDRLVDAERGRGLGLMQALVDRVDLTTRPEAGTIVTLEKVLAYADDALPAGDRKQV
jgi:serine/threonine-protein kinase RsbW